MGVPEDLLTVTMAAHYLGVTRQAILALTKRPAPGLGRRVGSVWLFTRSELDAYRARPRLHGGRPPGSKIGSAIVTPALAP